MSARPGSAAAQPALLDRARAGDPAAFARLVAAHQDRVYRLALRLLDDEQDAEETVQDVFLQVWRRLHAFRGDARFTTWLYRIATNAALMHRRARRRHRDRTIALTLPQFDEAGRHDRLDVNYAVAARVEGLLETEELARAVRAALDQLPDRYRVAFVLCDLEDLTAVEAGAIVGAPAATVRQRVHRARLMLRGRLGHLAGSETP